jgi:hypothetical protein
MEVNTYNPTTAIQNTHLGISACSNVRKSDSVVDQQLTAANAIKDTNAKILKKLLLFILILLN